MITNDWLTQEQDLQAAATIVAKHTDFNDSKPLALLHMFVIRRKTTSQVVEVKVQEWVLELLKYFREQYGWEQGSSVTGKVITRLLLKGETIH
ncbi:MAG: hypothetical protein WBE18_04360 [Gammaproteobacteria bacterium]